jgi:hypothetical protein
MTFSLYFICFIWKELSIKLPIISRLRNAFPKSYQRWLDPAIGGTAIGVQKLVIV